jgi:hypothetical protein
MVSILNRENKFLSFKPLKMEKYLKYLEFLNKIGNKFVIREEGNIEFKLEALIS